MHVSCQQLVFLLESSYSASAVAWIHPCHTGARASSLAGAEPVSKIPSTMHFRRQLLTALSTVKEYLLSVLTHTEWRPTLHKTKSYPRSRGRMVRPHTFEHPSRILRPLSKIWLTRRALRELNCRKENRPPSKLTVHQEYITDFAQAARRMVRTLPRFAPSWWRRSQRSSRSTPLFAQWLAVIEWREPVLASPTGMASMSSFWPGLLDVVACLVGA